MIDAIRFKFGRAIDLEPTSITTTPVTVFVGPNNSGKSKVLAEIAHYCRTGTTLSSNVVIDSISLAPIPPSLATDKINQFKVTPTSTDILQEGQIIVGKTRKIISRSGLEKAFLDPNRHIKLLCDLYLNQQTIILDGTNRIKLINKQQGGNLHEPPKSSFQVLLHDGARRKKVRKITFEAFGQYAVIDPTHLGFLQLRLSATEPNDESEEIGLHKNAIDFHAKAIPIDQTSDGVKAFTGMIIECIAGDPDILLIDEPEAFLHPSLSFKLGKEISEIMSTTNRRLFVSTHSANFVMGCIQSGAPVSIVRLTYKNGAATARVLPKDDILSLMRNPLLRSTGVLAGLFYESVIVTEADTDRAFYQEINERMLKQGNGKGIPNCLFLHAQNKQTVKTIIKPLRELGIPVAGIVDIDVLKDGGGVWTSFLESGFIPEMEKNHLSTFRSDINNKFKASGREMKKDGGIRILGRDDQEALSNLLSQLERYGLFVVPGGEVEDWLKHLGCTGHGPGWLIDVFDKMGEDPLSRAYLLPSEDDVWAFLDKIARWFANPERCGIPQ